MMNSDRFAGVRERIDNASNILLATHLKPDGDAIGSTLGMAEFLKSRGKNCSVVLPEGIPELYSLMPYDYLAELPEDDSQFDLVILLDTAVPNRAGFAAIGAVPEKIVDRLQLIDHHPDNPGYGKWNYLERRAATAEIAFELCESFNGGMPVTAASFFLMGLFTDTGGLRFDNTDPAALRSAARMLEAGANHNKVVNTIYFSKPYNQLQFESELLSNYVRWGCSRKAAWAYVPQSLLDKYQFDLRNAEGVIDELRAIAGTEVVAIITNRAPGSYRISMRSKNLQRPVIDLARRFNGGGHAMAAGMSLEFGSFEEASDFFAEEVKSLFADEETRK